MLELERLVDAAVREAPAPKFDRVDRIVRRRRLRRVLVRTAAIGGLIVAVAAFLAVPRDGRTSSIATRNTAGPTTPSSTTGLSDMSTADLRRRLEALGHTVRVTIAAHPGEFTLLGVVPTMLCVDNVRVVQTYEYASDATRTVWSRAISRDGGSVTRGNVRREMLWIAPPHFFARGKVVVLYVGGDRRLIADLASILGTTIDPNAPHSANTPEQTC